MTEQTQKKILKAIHQALADLDQWLSSLGVSKAKVISIYDAVIRENGLAAQLVNITAKQALPSVDTDSAQPELFERELARIHSGESATWLLSLPEPTPEQLSKILTCYKNAVPNVRKQFLNAARVGPRQRRGGRPKELADPEVRCEIREMIKNLREPGTKLEDLFQRLGTRYGVSATTIKRIWLET